MPTERETARTALAKRMVDLSNAMTDAMSQGGHHMILVRPEHRDDLLSAAGLIVLGLACASKLEAYRKALEEIVKAYDSGNLQMRSPEIGAPENGIPYHEWHEEWLHFARKALAAGE